MHSLAILIALAYQQQPTAAQQAGQVSGQAAAQYWDVRVSGVETRVKGLEDWVKVATPQFLDASQSFSERLDALEKAVSEQQKLKTCTCEHSEQPKVVEAVAQQTEAAAQQTQATSDLIGVLGDLAGRIATNPNTPGLIDKLTDPQFNVNAVMTALLGWMAWMARKRTLATVTNPPTVARGTVGNVPLKPR